MDLLEELNALGINTSEGIAHFGGKKDFYERMLKKFPSTAASLDVKAEMDAGNFEQAFMNAHSMKGICGNLYLGLLVEKYSDLTEALRDGKDIELAKTLVDPVVELQQKIIAAIGE